jgi:hypothetical protein
MRAADPTRVPDAVKNVKLDPSPDGLPGSEVLQGLIDGLGFWALLAALAGVLIGAAIWAIASYTNNHHWAASGRRGTLAAGIAALVIGAAPALVNFFAEAGGKVH